MARPPKYSPDDDGLVTYFCLYCNEEKKYEKGRGPLRKFCTPKERVDYYEDRRDHYAKREFADAVDAGIAGGIEAAVNARLTELFGHDPARKRRKTDAIRIDNGGYLIDFTPAERQDLLNEIAAIEDEFADIIGAREYGNVEKARQRDLHRDQVMPILNRLRNLLTDPND